MKKPKPITLSKISPQDKAAQLKRSMGKEHAHKMASNLAKNLKATGTADLNVEISSLKDVRKNEHFWTHVASLLSK